jgi:integrase
VTVRRSGDFNVLSPAELDAVCRAARDELEQATIRTAAESGLRMGELRALRWRDLDFERRLIHVRWAYTRSDRGRPKSSYVRST